MNQRGGRKRVLFVRHRAIGDVLLTTPFFRHLKAMDSEIQIDLYSQVEGIYETLPGFGKYISISDVHIDDVLKAGYDEIYWFYYEYDRNYNILDSYEISTGLTLNDRQMCWKIKAEEKDWARDLIASDQRLLIGFSPTCGHMLRSLPLVKAQAIIDKIHQTFSMKPLLISDGELDLNDCMNLSGKTTIRELAAVISLCDVCVTVDSAPLHIAQALNVPTVAIFGATLPELIVSTPSNLHAVMAKALPCLGCYHRIQKGAETISHCARGDLACTNIDEGDVVAAIHDAMDHVVDEALLARLAEYSKWSLNRMNECSPTFVGEIRKDYQRRIRIASDPNFDDRPLFKRLEQWVRHAFKGAKAR